MSKNFRINLDLKRPDCTPLNGFKQGDNLSVINGTILQDSTPYNLTGLTLRANFKLPDGTVKFQNATLTNAIEGEFSITVLSSVLEKTGIVLADISVFNADKKITSSTFKMTVAESIYNDGAIAGENGKDLLEQILENEADRVNSEKTRKANEIVRIGNEDVRKANEIAREDNESKRKIGYSKMDTRIDNLVLGQGSATEVIDSRLDGISNIKYPTLKARLDDTSNQLTQNALATLTTSTPVTSLDNATDGITQIGSIKGKTLQNLLGKQGTSIFKQTSTPQTIRKFENLNLKSGVQYTIIVSITDFVGTENLLVVQNPGTKTIATIKKDGMYIITFTPIDTNAVWIYFLSGGSSVCNTKAIMLLEGDFTSNPPIYFEGIKSVAEAEGNKIGIMSLGKNLFDKSTIIKGMMFISNTGGTSVKVDAYISDYINVLQNTKYVIKHGIGSATYGHCFYSADKNYIGGIISSSGMDTQQVITIPENCAYIRISGLLTKLDTQQLEKKDVLTEYNQYVEDKIEILLKEPLRSAGNAKDIINVASNELITATKKTLLSQELDWRKEDASLPLTIRFSASLKGAKSSPTVVSNYPSTGKTTAGIDEETIQIAGEYILMRILKTKLSTPDLAGFKKWLTENPTEIIYELAEPIITDLKASTLKSYKDGSIQLNNTIRPIVDLKYPTSISGRLSSVESTLDNTVDRTKKLEEGLFTTVAQTIDNKKDIGTLGDEVSKARNGKPDLKTEIDTIKTSVTTKADKDGATLTNLIAIGLINGSYAKKTDGNGVALFGKDNCMIILYAIDIGTPTNFIVAMGYKNSGKNPVLNIVSNNTLTIGNANPQGTQVILGGKPEYIVCYGVSIQL